MAFALVMPLSMGPANHTHHLITAREVWACPCGEDPLTSGLLQPSRTPVTPGRPASPPGGEAGEVLAVIGMADKLDELVAKRIIALG